MGDAALQWETHVHLYRMPVLSVEPTPDPDPPRRARALLPQLSLPRAQYHVVEKAPCGADRGELATFSHTPAHVHTQVLVTQKTFTHIWQVNLKKRKFWPHRTTYRILVPQPPVETCTLCLRSAES